MDGGVEALDSKAGNVVPRTRSTRMGSMGFGGHSAAVHRHRSTLTQVGSCAREAAKVWNISMDFHSRWIPIFIMVR